LFFIALALAKVARVKQGAINNTTAWRGHIEHLKCVKTDGLPGLCSRPHWGAYNAHSDPLAGGEGLTALSPKNSNPALGHAGLGLWP